jgi:hypothetical protein
MHPGSAIPLYQNGGKDVTELFFSYVTREMA